MTRPIASRIFLAGLFAGALMPLVAAPAIDGTRPQEQFATANHALEKGALTDALPIYQSLLGKGFEGAALFYNLGNLYYRRGERGQAVLYYERALRLAPRDPDIAFNLSLARSHIKDAEDPFYRTLFLYFTTSELGVALTILSWIFFGLLGLAYLGPSRRMEGGRRVATVVSGTLLLLTLAWFGINVSLTREPLGIVVTPPGEVRNGPGTDYAVGFTIPEGTKVLLLSQRPDWVQVGVPQPGLKGWMPANEVEPITWKSAS